MRIQGIVLFIIAVLVVAGSLAFVNGAFHHRSAHPMNFFGQTQCWRAVPPFDQAQQ